MTAESKHLQAATKVNSVTSVLYALLWAGDLCQSARDFEQFHVLVLELAPRLGVKLEQAVIQLGVGPAGLFDEHQENGNA